MRSFIAITLSVTLLTNCGGGGTTLTENIDRSYNSDQNIATDIIKEYSNGNAVIAVKGDLEDGGIEGATPRYYFVLSEDTESVLNTFEGVVTWESVENYLDDGAEYGVIREGVNSKGQRVWVDTYGVNLNLSGSEYASLSAVEVGDKAGFLSSGTIIQRLPSGKHTYQGGAIIGVNDLVEGDNNLLLVADFDDRTLSFTAATENLFASANNVTIDIEAGSFSSEGGGILGERETTYTQDAAVLGAFAGTNAGGVHGVMYPTVDSETEHGFAVFVGAR